MVLDYNTILIDLLNEDIADAISREYLDRHLAMLQLISKCNNVAIISKYQS